MLFAHRCVRLVIKQETDLGMTGLWSLETGAVTHKEPGRGAHASRGGACAGRMWRPMAWTMMTASTA